MIKFLKGLVIVFIFCSGPVESQSVSASGQSSYSAYDALYQDLTDIENITPRAGATVDSFAFSRDQANFLLVEGQVYVLKHINNKPAVLIFSGTGQFSFAPPIESEAEQLKRFY